MNSLIKNLNFSNFSNISECMKIKTECVKNFITQKRKKQIYMTDFIMKKLLYQLINLKWINLDFRYSKVMEFVLIIITHIFIKIKNVLHKEKRLNFIQNKIL